MAAAKGSSPRKKRKSRTAGAAASEEAAHPVNSTTAARLQFLASLCGLDETRGHLIAVLFWGEVRS